MKNSIENSSFLSYHKKFTSEKKLTSGCKSDNFRFKELQKMFKKVKLFYSRN